MKRIIKVLMVCVLLCLIAAAAAAVETTTPEESRILPRDEKGISRGLPPGMVAQVEMRANGYLDIVIDTFATDWDKVAAAARKSGSLVIYPGIEAPRDQGGNPAVKGIVFVTDIARRGGESLAEAETRVLESLLKNPGYGDNGNTVGRSYQGWSIGSYDEGTGLFLPMPIEQGWASFAVGWRMNDDSIRVELVRFHVSFKGQIPVYTSRRLVKKEDIETGIVMNNASLTGNQVKVEEITNGSVVYRIPDGVTGEVHTAIAAPYKADWQAAYLLSNGKEEWRQIRTGSYFDGRQYIVQFYNVEKSNLLDKKDWAIKWVDDQNNEVVTGLEAVFKIGSPMFTAAYDGIDQDRNPKPAASAMPVGRLKAEISIPLNGLDVSVSDGHIHMSIDEEKLPANRKTDLSLTTMSAKVLTPQDAEFFKVYSLRGDIIYGDWGERQNFIDRIPVRGGEWISVPDFTKRNFFKAYNVVLHNGKYMTYYVAPTPVGRYGGETLIFEWGLKGGKTSREYVALTMDSYQIRRNPSETMNPNKLVEVPTVQANMRMDVETAMLPQMGENVIRHEITLYDDNGNKSVLKQPVKLYLPYPDGKTMDECKNDLFVVYHQIGENEQEEYSVEKGNLMLTEYGLCMEVTSFSPYFLNWEEAPDASGLPETGDRTSIAGYALMLALCGACAVALEKRRAAVRK